MVITESMKRRVGAHFVVGFHGETVSADIKSLIQRYFVGAVILFKRNVVDGGQTRALINELQSLARDAGHERPLLIGIDQENGLVSAFGRPDAGTQFPGAMALAAAGSPELARQVAFLTGKELKLVGINWVYSPVADVNNNPRNPVIGVRSYGDDPSKVSNYVSAVAQGLTDAGVAPCAKHFPGHGDTAVDSHLALPVINKSRAEIDGIELPPFKALISQDVASVMTGHMAFPKLTSSDSPCSLSRAVTTDLLRTEMGFRGLIVTDCLEMDAISDQVQGGCGVEEGAVRALVAGADIVMICHTIGWQTGAILKAYEAIQSGRVTLDESRINTLKDNFIGGWDSLPSATNDAAFADQWRALKSESAALSKKAYSLSTALLNASNYAPLASGKPVILYTPLIESLNKAVDEETDGVLLTKEGKLRNTAGPSFMSFASSIAKRAPCTHMVYEPQASLSVPDDCVAVVFSLRNADRWQWQLDSLGRLSQSTKKPIVVVGSCAPYEAGNVKHYPYVACFEYTSPALENAASVIFGETAALGSVPVVI
ncbi:Glycoside hydrolase family 3 protein [Mycena indigotica]|uniref:Glycoside hydrolase family 3 protein n=1 Tax=Mycena indigotica TaxID=2126181 RepID=A0A8H6T2C3_9AGAR|nr:Glycoside hydrolase family 3 protein [Mycena indigotica]KAF7309619.1 Glycoside hydrolase family 3 protein [Mycena indigotica]